MKKRCINIMVFSTILMLTSCSKSNDQLERDCENGDMKTCTRIGVHYAFATHGRERNYDKAKYFLEKSCNSNEGDGCKELALLYEHARGVTRDLSKAATLYEKACKNNDDFGCYYLGDFYRLGKGVKKDVEKSKESYKRACALGLKLGCEKEQIR